MRIARPVLLNYMFSPYGIAILSTLVFLVAWTFPSGLYSSLVDEPDLMYFDAETLLFFLLCVVGFCAGLLLVDLLLPSPELLASKIGYLQFSRFKLMLPLAVTTTMTTLAGLELIRRAPNLLVLLMSQQGGDVKAQFADTQLGLVGWGATMQTVVLWWTYWRLSTLEPETAGSSRMSKFAAWTVFAIGVIAQLALSTLRVSRSDLMPVFAGFAILYVVKKIQNRKLETAGLLSYLLFFPLGVAAVFVGFGLLRGINDMTVGLADFVGYTLASYNRLTALLKGTMVYPYGGHGVYLSAALASNNALNVILPLREAFGWPSYIDLWSSEFQAPQIAGLNDRLIWSGAFGYLFADFGWATPLILTGYGVFYAGVWRSMKSGTAFGVTLYPWVAFSALSWFSSNLVFDYRFTFFVLAAIVLTVYERILATRWI